MCVCGRAVWATRVWAGPGPGGRGSGRVRGVLCTVYGRCLRAFPPAPTPPPEYDYEAQRRPESLWRGLKQGNISSVTVCRSGGRSAPPVAVQ